MGMGKGFLASHSRVKCFMWPYAKCKVLKNECKTAEQGLGAIFVIK